MAPAERVCGVGKWANESEDVKIRVETLNSFQKFVCHREIIDDVGGGACDGSELREKSVQR